MKKLFTYWMPVILWAGLIFYLSNKPNLKSPYEYDFFLRKIAHMVEFAILNIFIWRALMKRGLSNKKALILGGILAAFYAASDEYHQSFILGRSGNLRDVGIDSLGILISGGVLWLVKKPMRFVGKL